MRVRGRLWSPNSRINASGLSRRRRAPATRSYPEAGPFRKGLGGVWDHLRGEHASIQRQIETEAYASCATANSVTS